MKDFINELFIKYHLFWLGKALTKEGVSAHMNAMFYHIRKRSNKQIVRMERKRGVA